MHLHPETTYVCLAEPHIDRKTGRRAPNTSGAARFTVTLRLRGA